MAVTFSDKKLHKIGRIDQIVRDYFEDNPTITEIPAKDLMKIFISKGIFFRNHRDGLPIRNLLRNLDKENKMDLLKHIKVIRHPVNRRWYFTK